MDTTDLTEQQLRDYAANYLVLRRVGCEPQAEAQLEPAMAQAIRQVAPDDPPTPDQFDRVMAVMRGVLAAAEGR